MRILLYTFMVIAAIIALASCGTDQNRAEETTSSGKETTKEATTAQKYEPPRSRRMLHRRPGNRPAKL